jgi:hypothetical protein
MPSVEMQNDRAGFWEGKPVTGTTTSSLIKVADIDIAFQFEATGLVIQNAGATNELNYTVRTKLSELSTEIGVLGHVGVTVPISSSSPLIVIKDPVSQVKVYVQSTISTAATNFVVHSSGRRYERKEKR